MKVEELFVWREWKLASPMDSETPNNKGKGRMWALQQQLDQPMDDEAEKIRNGSDSKVSNCNSLFLSFLIWVLVIYSRSLDWCDLNFYGMQNSTTSNLHVAKVYV